MKKRDVQIKPDTHSFSAGPVAGTVLNRRAFLGRAAGLAAAATAGLLGVPAARATTGSDKLFLIGLEEHFATQELRQMQGAGEARLFSGGRRRPELLDLGANRIATWTRRGLTFRCCRR